MSDQERREHLLLVTDHFLAAHREWVESDVAYLTEAVEAACDELVEVFASGSIPADCRELYARAEAFTAAWNVYKTEVQTKGQNAAKVPGQAFWRAVEALEDARQGVSKPRRKTLESIAELTAQKVPDRQICIIYGWRLPDGSPDFDRLAEERAKPGTHTGAGFVNPVEQAQRERQRRAAESLERLRRERERKLERLTRVAPESLEELVRQGVSAKQIAAMLKISVDEVYARCDAENLPRPQEAYADIRTERGLHARDLNESEQRIMDALGGHTAVLDEEEPTDEAALDVATDPALTLEQQIVSLRQQGLDPAEIAARLGCGERKVAAILKRWEKEPEAFR